MLLLAAIILGACSSEDTVKDTVSNYLRTQLKNPDSFKIESIEIRKDTIPCYLSNQMFSIAKEAAEAMEEYNRYKDRGYLWAEEKYESTQKMLIANETLKNAYNSSLKDDATVEYVAYVRFSGTNAMGGTVSNKVVVVVDKEDPKKILGSFDIDGDFLEQFIIIKMVGSDYKFDLKQNKYGKYETDGLPYFEQFLLNETN